MAPKPESKSSEDKSRIEVFDGPRENHSTHSVIHTAADGWSTHDYERIADNNGNTSVVVNAPDYQGNVIAGSEQYDTGWDDASFNEALTSQEP